MNDMTLSTLNILIIDDDPDARELLTIILEQQNATVFVATDGREGLNIATRQPLDLIISDISMPRLSGWDLIRMIRSLPNMDNIPIVALTAFADTYSKRRAEAAGFHHFMTKPIIIDMFLSELEQVLAEIAERKKSDD